MRELQLVLLSAMLAVACVIAYELVRLNRSLQPLARIPVVNAVSYGRPDETREQRIDRIARSRIQTRDDDRAVDERVRELLLVRQNDSSASPKQSLQPARR